MSYGGDERSSPNANYRLR